MKISKNTAHALIMNVRSYGTEDRLNSGSLTYTLDDMIAAFTVSVSGRQAFAGLSFEMIGRDFHILPNLDIILSESASEEDEVYSIEDGKFTSLIEDYLKWRTSVLENIKM